jgi:LuxR family maltose regulon positive regulatory protein
VDALAACAQTVGERARTGDTDRAVPAQTVLGSLVDDLDQLAGPTVLALDDYHVIDNPAVHEAVGYLLDSLPPQATLAIATRADPPLPLARLRGSGELVEPRAADLRFSTDETAAFPNQIMGLELSPPHVAALEDRIEGWAAGLQLAGLSLRGHDDPDRFVTAFAGSHRFVLDYLVEEVLNSQSGQVREFLLDTSMLRELAGPLCDALTGRTAGTQTLEQLERDNLFLVPLDDERQWYRYHHLFADMLRSRLISRHPERTTALHRAASRGTRDPAGCPRRSFAGGRSSPHAWPGPGSPRATSPASKRGWTSRSRQ